MNNTDFLESILIEELVQVGTCTIEDLYVKVPYYSSNQVLFVVDKLTREGTLVFKFLAPSRYVISLAPSQSMDARPWQPLSPDRAPHTTRQPKKETEK